MKKPPFSLASRTILLTGASSGLGEQLALLLAQKDARLILIARNQKRLNQVAAACQKRTSQPVMTYECDLTKPTELVALLERLQTVDVDIIINNAGVGYFKEAVQLSDFEISNMLSLNLEAVITVTQFFLPKLILKKDGMIVQIASQAAKTATPKTTIYAASKFGVLGYSNALRLELKKHHIHVMTVNPGPIATDFFKIAEPSGHYLKQLGSFVLSPEVVAKHIVKGMERKKREVNLPLTMNLASQLNQLFPRLGDSIIMKVLNKK